MFNKSISTTAYICGSIFKLTVKMKWLKRLGLVIIGLYVLVCVGLYFVQEQLLFRPSKLAESHNFRKGEEVEIPTSDDISINCLLLKQPNPKGVILYLHGNRGSNQRCLYQAESGLAGNGFDILMPDYRGYGKTEGKIYSEKQMQSDAQAVYDYLLKNYPEDKIIIVGYSMGTGMATKLAAKNNPNHLFLIAPYFSIVDMKNRYLPFIPNFILKYPLRNDKNVMKIKCPITIFHGTADEVLPYDSSTKLKNLRPDHIRLVTLDNESHRRSIFHPIVNRTISDLLP